MNDSLARDADGVVRSTKDGGTAEALLWWRRVPRWPGEIVGVIGGFQATGEAAAADVLTQAGAELRAQGCSCAIGPMDGSTWRAYRFVTDAGTEPPFLFEPVHPPEWPRWWQMAGFVPLAEYYSTATPDLTARDARVTRAAVRLAAEGVVIRPVDLARFDEELARIHAVSVVSFQSNFLYTPLSREEFVAQYRDVKKYLKPELVLLAERAGRPVGYVFALPDLLAAQRGQPVTSIIVKTLSVLPGRAQAGLGAVLLAEVHAVAGGLGYRRAIHALMHETNPSLNLSAHYASAIRRYTLFKRPLAPA